MKIITSNERICRFYEANKSINFEAVNLIFIDLFDKLLSDMNATMNVTINSQILSSVNQNTLKINEMNSSLSYLKDAVQTMNAEITNNLLLKFNDVKQNYVNDLRTIVKQNTNEDVCSLLEKNNNLLIDKTILILNDIVPKSQNHYYSQIHESIRSFHKSISDDTRVLLKCIDNNTMKDYINNFEMKSSMMLQNLQQPIYTYIAASEERINTNISSIKDNSNVQNKLFGELAAFLNNFRDSGEFKMTKNNQMGPILNKLYTTSEVTPLVNNLFTRTNGIGESNMTENNIHIIKRINKPKVLIQSINIDRNVNGDEVREFVEKIEENKCNGIFLSQQSGFSNKTNFQIEIYNKLILVYIHNCNYSGDMMKSAIDIIDHLANKLREFNNENEFEFNIDKDILEEINKEYQNFISQKESIINVLKETQKKVFNQIDEIKFPSLDKYLSTKFGAPVHKQGLKCDLCKNFNANNLKALAAHKRGCSRKNIILVKPSQ